MPLITSKALSAALLAFTGILEQWNIGMMEQENNNKSEYPLSEVTHSGQAGVMEWNEQA